LGKGRETEAALVEGAIEEIEVLGAEALGQKEIDVRFFEGGAELKHEIELLLVQLVPELREGAREIVPGDRSKIGIAHRLLRQLAQQIHANAVRNIHALPQCPALLLQPWDDAVSRRSRPVKIAASRLYRSDGR
jgi:hypothetical protein